MCHSHLKSRLRWVLNMTAMCLSLVLFATISGYAQFSNDPDQTEARVASALSKLHDFSVSHSLNDLRATSELLFYVDFNQIRPENLVARRRSIVDAFAKTLHQIDLATEHSFDPDDPKNWPQVCLTPDREPSGRQLPSCADPKAILDGPTRDRYIAAIRANDRKNLHLQEQTMVRRIEQETMQELRIILSSFRGKTAQDGAALDDILLKAGLSDARREKIRAMY